MMRTLSWLRVEAITSQPLDAKHTAVLRPTYPVQTIDMRCTAFSCVVIHLKVVFARPFIGAGCRTNQKVFNGIILSSSHYSAKQQPSQGFLAAALGVLWRSNENSERHSMICLRVEYKPYCAPLTGRARCYALSRSAIPTTYSDKKGNND